MDIFEIISQKTWTQLSGKELGQLMDMGIDEQQFSVLKNNWSDYSNQPTLEPSNEMKSNLDQAFAEKFGQQPVSSFAYWKWASIAAVGLIIIGVGVSFLVGPKDTVQLAKAEFEQEEESVGSIPNVDSTVKDEQKEDLKIEIPPAIVQINEAPKHLGMFVPTQDDIKQSEETMAELFEKAEVDIIKSENVASSSKMISKESRSDQAMPVQELPRASSSNSTTNSVVAYRKMMEDTESISDMDKVEIKVVKLSDLNIKSNGLINLY